MKPRRRAGRFCRPVIVSILAAVLPTSWALAQAAPLFPNPEFRVGDSPRAVVAADFNGDGLNDGDGER